jgi:hypothetical protein
MAFCHVPVAAHSGYARSRLKLPVTLRDLLAATDLLLTVGPDSLW